MINYLSSFKQEALCKGREVGVVYVAFVVLKGLALGVQAPHGKQINVEGFLNLPKSHNSICESCQDPDRFLRVPSPSKSS